ncbi:hypothetical protein OG930_28490 [Streptomyces sp. NBC_01799]|uniref:hypothetical protein n=1 Tax=Streptomyces sp. NBC_01800 TaxID=2975945 RepID=UPI003090D5E7|nr:hypothetical protein OG930_28490 [Streptomyces sp. NBC_01799]
MPTAPIPPSPFGAPVRPPGVVGSITHCTGYRAAAVALRARVLSVGIDAEPVHRCPPMRGQRWSGPRNGSG